MESNASLDRLNEFFILFLRMGSEREIRDRLAGWERLRDGARFSVYISA